MPCFLELHLIENKMTQGWLGLSPHPPWTQPKWPRRTLGRESAADPEGSSLYCSVKLSTAMPATRVPNSWRCWQLLLAQRKRKRAIFILSELRAFGETRGGQVDRGLRGIPVGPPRGTALPPPTQSRCGGCSLVRRVMYLSGWEESAPSTEGPLGRTSWLLFQMAGCRNGH